MRTVAGLEHPSSSLVGLDAAAQHGADAREQLAGRVRLRHVVVGAELEPDHDVDLAVLRGQHDDRHGRAGADLAAHLGAREPGQHEVEQHEVGAVAVELGDRGRAVGGDGRLVALALEQVGERLAERRLVFDDAGCGSRGFS